MIVLWAFLVMAQNGDRDSSSLSEEVNNDENEKIDKMDSEHVQTSNEPSKSVSFYPKKSFNLDI